MDDNFLNYLQNFGHLETYYKYVLLPKPLLLLIIFVISLKGRLSFALVSFGFLATVLKYGLTFFQS